MESVVHNSPSTWPECDFYSCVAFCQQKTWPLTAHQCWVRECIHWESLSSPTLHPPLQTTHNVIHNTHAHTPHKQTHLCNSGLVVTLLHNYVHTHSTCSVYITLHWRAPECNSPHMGHVIIMSTWLCLTSMMRWRHMIKWQWPVYQLCFPYISCSFIATPRRNLQ